MPKHIPKKYLKQFQQFYERLWEVDEQAARYLLTEDVLRHNRIKGNSKHAFESPNDFLRWASTPQGWDYWREIQRRWEKEYQYLGRPFGGS